MNCKRILALVFSLLLLSSLGACKLKIDFPDRQEQTTAFDDVITESAVETVYYTENIILNTTSEYYVEESSTLTTSETTSIPTQSELATTEAYDDPGSWSKERIVEEYKNAAIKSNPTAKSTTSITLKDISVNNGEHDKAISFVKPIIAKFIESNSTESDGITGGFRNLVPQDVSSAKAYKSGNDTVIEMIMVEQTSGPDEDALSGSVGHAITAVGDIGKVVKDLEERGLPLELSQEDTKIYYTNPIVKVVINDNGEIISGTWSYTVKISMNNFKAFGQNVEKAYIIMDNTITV